MQLVAAAEPYAAHPVKKREQRLVCAVCPTAAAKQRGSLCQRQQHDFADPGGEQQLAVESKALLRLSAGADGEHDLAALSAAEGGKPAEDVGFALLGRADVSACDQ